MIHFVTSYPLVHITSSVIALKTITLLLGGLITYFSFKAYRRSGARPLKFLAVGFGAVTLGALLAGAIDQLTALRSSLALIVESALTALGFGVIVYSLYTY